MSILVLLDGHLDERSWYYAACSRLSCRPPRSTSGMSVTSNVAPSAVVVPR